MRWLAISAHPVPSPVHPLLPLATPLASPSKLRSHVRDRRRIWRVFLTPILLHHLGVGWHLPARLGVAGARGLRRLPSLRSRVRGAEVLTRAAAVEIELKGPILSQLRYQCQSDNIGSLFPRRAATYSRALHRMARVEPIASQD